MNATIKIAGELKAEIAKVLFLADVPALKGLERLNVDKSKVTMFIHLD